MRIGSVTVVALALCGLCLACSGQEATPSESSVPAQVDEELSTPSTPEFAIRKLPPRKAEAREAIEARLSRAERRLEKLRNGQAPLEADELAELESKMAEAQQIFDEMEEVRGADWDRLLVEAERTVEELERGLDG